MEELQARGDLYTRQLIKEKRRIETLQTQLNDVHSKIATTRESNKQKAISLLNKYTITKSDAYLSSSRRTKPLKLKPQD